MIEENKIKLVASAHWKDKVYSHGLGSPPIWVHIYGHNFFHVLWEDAYIFVIGISCVKCVFFSYSFPSY